MRRVLMIAGAVAAMAAFSNRAMAAHTAAELHIFFGSGVSTAGDIPASPSAGDILVNPAAIVSPGGSVVFPIWMRVLPGDGPTTWFGIGLRVFGEGATAASFSNGGNADNPALGGWTPSQRVIPGPGSGAPLSSVPSLREFRSGQYIVKGGTDSNLGVGTYLLGYMQVNAAPSAVLNDHIDLSFVTGGGLTTQTNGSTGSATLATVAFGAGNGTNGLGLLNTFRRDNTNLDIQGYGFASNAPDASVTVVPEPTTIALLGLGLLAARRRKLA